MTDNKLDLQANCQAVAMGIMPHTDVERTLYLTFSLDIPFFPQLPIINFYENIYVQTSQNLSGIVVDQEDEKISFDTAKFIDELGGYSQKMAEPETFALS